MLCPLPPKSSGGRTRQHVNTTVWEEGQEGASCSHCHPTAPQRHRGNFHCNNPQWPPGRHQRAGKQVSGSPSVSPFEAEKTNWESRKRGNCLDWAFRCVIILMNCVSMTHLCRVESNCSQVARGCESRQPPQATIRSPLMQAPRFERFSCMEGSVDHVWVDMSKDLTVSTATSSQYPPST